MSGWLGASVTGFPIETDRGAPMSDYHLAAHHPSLVLIEAEAKPLITYALLLLFS